MRYLPGVIIPLLWLLGCSDAVPPSDTDQKPTPPTTIVKTPTPPVADTAKIYGPLPKPLFGYGAFGRYDVEVEKIPNPRFPADRHVTTDIYYPADLNRSVPVLFFAPGWGGDYAGGYDVLLRYIASRGYVAIFAAHNIDSYSTEDLFEAFGDAVDKKQTLIDTSRVGYIGHSYGGGAIAHLLQRFYDEKGWGENSAFLYMTAPWIMFDMQESDLDRYPSHVRLLIAEYEEDLSTDLRIPISFFNRVAIPASHKRYLTVRSHTVDGYRYRADHGTPITAGEALNALDYDAVFRPLGMLMAATFEGDTNASEMLFGNRESLESETKLSPLLLETSPSVAYPPSRYSYKCDDPRNPLRQLCEE
ncbi:MAG: hypothetical protein B6D59_08160 [Campylobacteraceae bacterium 4484_4]|nr:MAG: hypothetical protein B6D59_08160 [Campylobacteraceae bacterium 4484_4]